MKSEKIPYFIPALSGPSEEEVAKAREILEAHKKAIKEQHRNTLLQCTTQVATGKGCGAYTSIKDLVYIQTHWYTPPYGCTGGDYWSQGEGKWICPECQHVNRLYETPEIEERYHHFKEIKKVYDD